MKKIQPLFIVLVLAGLTLINSGSTQVPALSGQQLSRTVEDGGTGPYPAIMLTESTLPTHTVFRPKDMTAIGNSNKLPVLAWGNGA